MIRMLLEKSGHAEVFIRSLVILSRPIKNRIKRMVRKGKNNRDNISVNQELVEIFKNILKSCGVHKGDIVLIHSSYDGLQDLGLDEEEILDTLMDIFCENTVVFATFPIEPSRKKDIYTYNPQKNLCWTGMIPNKFLTRKGVIRAEFPYNTLAACGDLADDMMKQSGCSSRPHDKYSAWEFCRVNHAKILFLGTTSREANTMAIHMIPDIMGDDWPIDNWYEKRRYRIKVEEREYEKTIEIQRGFWYRFVNEYKTDKLLKDNGYLKDISVDNIQIELVSDAYEMVEYLKKRCCNGNLMYKIPHKYYK